MKTDVTDTVSMQFVQRALYWLGKDSPSCDRLLREIDLQSEEISQREMRVPATLFSKVWSSVSRELQDEFFALDSRRMKPGSFALICRSLAMETRFDVAIESCLRSFALMLDDIEASLVCEGNFASLRINVRSNDPHKRVHATELYLTMVHGIMCWLAGRRVPLVRLDVDYPVPEHVSEYPALFTEAVQFSQSGIAAFFDARWLKTSISHGLDSVEQFLGSMPQSIVTKFKNASSVTLVIRDQLRRSPAMEWPDICGLARQMQMTTSTLQRRLDAEGASFTSLKLELRRDMAIELLRTTRKPICDIAADIGYKELSTFYRAFRQWTGTAPGSYRSFGQLTATECTPSASIRLASHFEKFDVPRHRRPVV